MNAVYFVWWNAERREPGLADNMGMGWVLPYLVISEILVICASVYLNKMHKSDSEKKLFSMEKTGSGNWG
ncbi:MAG: hypothetical protein K2N72_13585 [Oscillospiraceae bacterium]|nr:hypothetical protein [Oscillospiraceae bacterium]